jgi:hypothetical protein
LVRRRGKFNGFKVIPIAMVDLAIGRLEFKPEFGSDLSFGPWSPAHQR